MSHYKSDRRDLDFNLFEFLDIGNTSLGKGPFEDFTKDVAEGALDGLEKLAKEVVGPTLAPGDREPPVLREDGQVIVPDCIREATNTFFDGGWNLLGVPTEMGGYGAPPSIRWAAFEFMAGANPAVPFYAFGTFISMIAGRLGTPAQRDRFLPQAIDDRWGGAMVLTEPDAGSDVGSGRSKATHIEGDVWAIEGVKRFITNGEYDFAPNIMHLVLARPEGHGPGTKGLSMFIVPKIWINEDGSTGGDNNVRCIGLEHKMGLKASVTCEMSYGEAGQTRGLLVGGVHEGIRQMFNVIEYARMGVGCKSAAGLSTAYLNALEYAKERVQGPDLAKAADKTAPRVRIIEHPDVRRMLMIQKATAQGLRALNLFTASIQDQVEILGGHTSPEAQRLDRLNNLLLPLVKGYGSEKAYEVLSLSMQTFGGSGYVQDHPIEQYMRDQRVDAVYEGTTHIQALDLLFRKIARDGGQTLQGLLGEMQKTLAEEEGGETMAAARARLARALQDIQGIFGTLMAKMGESVYHVGLQGNRVLMSLGQLVIGWLLLRHGALAASKLEGAKGDDRHFYEGKIAVANWWCSQELPSLTLARKMVEQGDLDLMELAEEAF